MIWQKRQVTISPFESHFGTQKYFVIPKPNQIKRCSTVKTKLVDLISGTTIAFSKRRREGVMKKLLILGYILAVLVLSGMVKADGAIESAQINAQTGIMNVNGYLRDACYKNAQLAVSTIDETNASINLIVNSEHMTHVLCAEHTVPFAIVYDLKELPLNAGKTYSVQFIANASDDKEVYSYTALPKTGSDYKINLQPFKGILVYVSNPLDPEALTPALKRANQVVPVVSPDMTGDLKKFENQEVRLSGYAVQTAALDSQRGSQPLFQTTDPTVTAIIPVSVSR
jgi:hypothetical protein